MCTKQKFGLAIFLAIAVFVCRRFLRRYFFVGKRIVITGRSRGLGLAIARPWRAKVRPSPYLRAMVRSCSWEE